MIRHFSNWIGRNKKKSVNQQPANEEVSLSSDLNINEQVLRSIYEDCSDLVFRSFLISGKTKALLIYIEGMSNTEEIDAQVLSPLMNKSSEESSYQKLMSNKLAISKIKPVITITDCIEYLSIGNPVLLINGEKEGFALGLAKWEKRSIEEPAAESVIRGPRDGFTEAIGVNTSLIRRRIKTPNLKMKTIKIGRYTQSQVIMTYIDGLADHTLIEEVSNRLNRIDIDGVLDSGYIEELIEDDSFSPFPQVLNTERPDVAVAGLLEGRVVILVDGTPSSLIVPTTFYALMQSSEDYYQRFLFSTMIRWLRYLLVTVALLLPSLYVAILTYHAEMIPTSLLISVAASREQVPFPALVEALIMEVTFEALREAGVRLPKQIGSAVSIVGALVIGQAAIQAGIVSAPMVMVVAITGIASFTIPHYSAGIPLRILRFPMIILAGTLGLLGIMQGILFICIHLCTLRSFGVPYMSPMAPTKSRELKDAIMRGPWWMMNTRPHLTGEYDPYRESSHQKPGPAKGGDPKGRS